MLRSFQPPPENLVLPARAASARQSRSAEFFLLEQLGNGSTVFVQGANVGCGVELRIRECTRRGGALRFSVRGRRTSTMEESGQQRNHGDDTGRGYAAGRSEEHTAEL